MRKYGFLWLLCILTSCDWFPSKEVRTQRLVDQEMQTIDWNGVDQYPLFDNCDEVASLASQKACFENTLLGHFSATLNEFEYELEGDVHDTVFIDFKIDKMGAISLLQMNKNARIEDQIPEFEIIITRSLMTLPPVAPALKRGIPVGAKFRIPIVLNTK
ncbi:hypothetical protein [Sediminicola sp. 1XM1-17]|uniref:hypothetical protein n=1 Tax=Sediminicola sp. 1XM1-17 TaxID=3127702 RepID=UPI003078A5EB